MIRSNKAVNAIASTMKRKSRRMSKDSFYVGEGSVNLSSTRRTAHAPGQSAAHKKYLEQWGPMPKSSGSRGVKRVDRKGILDLYDE